MTTKTGILLINLGTPTDPSVASVRRYLAEFLSDKYVIDLPYLVRQLLLRLFILPTRPKKSAEAYGKIWDDKRGSPLMYHTQDLAKALQTQLGEQYVVTIGMRYQHPSIKTAIETLQQQCEKIVVLPLFPQYSTATTGSVIAKVKDYLSNPNIINDFYNHPAYIQAQAHAIKPYLNSQPFDKLVLSYHSLPVRQIRKNNSHCQTSCLTHATPCAAISEQNANCYRAQCYATSRELAHYLNLDESQYAVVFQSRLGKTAWIGPELLATLDNLYQQGARKILVACPSFVADCLETIEEIGMRAKEYWQTLGGDTLTLIPCMNANPTWVKAVAQIVIS